MQRVRAEGGAARTSGALPRQQIDELFGFRIICVYRRTWLQESAEISPVECPLSEAGLVSPVSLDRSLPLRVHISGEELGGPVDPPPAFADVLALLHIHKRPAGVARVVDKLLRARLHVAVARLGQDDVEQAALQLDAQEPGDLGHRPLPVLEHVRKVQEQDVGLASPRVPALRVAKVEVRRRRDHHLQGALRRVHPGREPAPQVPHLVVDGVYKRKERADDLSAVADDADVLDVWVFVGRQPVQVLALGGLVREPLLVAEADAIAVRILLGDAKLEIMLGIPEKFHPPNVVHQPLVVVLPAGPQQVDDLQKISIKSEYQLRGCVTGRLLLNVLPRGTPYSRVAIRGDLTYDLVQHHRPGLGAR